VVRVAVNSADRSRLETLGVVAQRQKDVEADPEGGDGGDGDDGGDDGRGGSGDGDDGGSGGGDDGGGGGGGDGEQVTGRLKRPAFSLRMASQLGARLLGRDSAAFEEVLTVVCGHTA
jgi:hypothetical protein